MPVGRKLGPTVERHRVSSPGTHRSGGGKTQELLPFVADSSPRSAAVRQRLDRLCESCLGPGDSYGVIDVLQDASQARRWRVALVPDLVVRAGTQTRRSVGVLRDKNGIVAAIDELRIAEEVP